MTEQIVVSSLELPLATLISVSGALLEEFPTPEAVSCVTVRLLRSGDDLHIFVDRSGASAR